MAKPDTQSNHPADSTRVQETLPDAEGSPPAGDAQDASWVKGSCDAAGVAAVMARPKPTRFYSLAEVGEMFGRAPRTIRHWIAQGHLKRTKVGNAMFISEHDIDALGVSPETSVDETT